MDSPQHLIEQVAKEKAVTVNQAKRALYLSALAAEGRTLLEAESALGPAQASLSFAASS
jgi:hypothetical protein